MTGPRFSLLVFVSLSCISALHAQDPAAKAAPNPAQEARASRYSAANAAAFLDKVAVGWTRERNCGTCHTNYPYLLARPTLDPSGSALTEVRGFFEKRALGWDGPDKAAKPRWDTEVVATAATLALHDARTTGKLHPATRHALDRMWTLQREDGAWNWLKCDWPPMEHDDYFGAVYAALGVGAAPEGYARSDKAASGLDRLKTWLKKNPAPDLHHGTWLLWSSVYHDDLRTLAEREATIGELRQKQRDDGGWSLPSLGSWKRRDGSANDPNAPSDGYATGLVVFVLRQAGVPATDPALQKGVEWLRTNQRESGRWFTRSLNNDKFHYISHAGTAFAVMALASCNAQQ